MPRYAAFLRGMSPMNAKMPELRKAFERAGFTNVATVLSSGNVVFDAERAPVRALERTAEAALQKHLGHPFVTIIRPVEGLKKLLWLNPYRVFELPPRAKKIVTFLRDRPSKTLRLPVEMHGTQILTMKGGMIYSVYVPSPKGAAFMAVIEKALGTNITTRTWETVAKVVRK
jgi:uncharacterized protein (DUF1697 family)